MTDHRFYRRAGPFSIDDIARKIRGEVADRTDRGRTISDIAPLDATGIGEITVFAGQSAISDHLTVGAGARVAGKSGVMRDVEAGVTVGGYPAMPLRQWHRQTATLARIAAPGHAKPKAGAG